MPRNETVAALLRWRLLRAEADAPPPPRASLLLDAARPWWERDPIRFRVYATRVQSMPAVLGYAMSSIARGDGGGLVPAVISAPADIETYVQLHYLSTLNGRLRLRFVIGIDTVESFRAFDTTFVADDADVPPFTTIAARSQSGEYRIDVDLPADRARVWSGLKVTDQMPFRLILQPHIDDSNSETSPATIE